MTHGNELTPEMEIDIHVKMAPNLIVYMPPDKAFKLINEYIAAMRRNYEKKA